MNSGDFKNAIKQGSTSAPLNIVSDAGRLILSVRFEGTGYQNSWNIWVYPKELPETGTGILYTRSFAEAKEALAQREKVLLNPKNEEINGFKFVQAFWSLVHFPNQSGTMGILCDPAHPALAYFPTEIHSD